ncbi:MAG: hypothetical protein ABI321_16055 [Polyangia bacterium]
MKILHLAFLLPALLAVAPALAEPARKPAPAEPIHYATLDRMLHEFAARARTEHTSDRPTLLAKR